MSANITLTNHLLEGASIASGSGGSAGAIASNPLISGASGQSDVNGVVTFTVKSITVGTDTLALVAISA